MKLLNVNEEVVYEKEMDAMPACWYLGRDEFVYMEDLASNRLTVVRMAKGAVKKADVVFQLPSEVVLKNPIRSEALDVLVEAHPCTDKQALKDLI